jgi:hypothetical protein
MRMSAAVLGSSPGDSIGENEASAAKPAAMTATPNISRRIPLRRKSIGYKHRSNETIANLHIQGVAAALPTGAAG